MRRVLSFFAAAVTAAWCSAGLAAFPERPVRLLVPYPAGGAVDIVSRTVGQQLSEAWGQPVVIENRPGAGGVVASQVLVKSPPDGYTLIVVASGHAVNPYLYQKLPYDTFADFTPVIELAYSPNILLVNNDTPAKTVAELIALAKAKPGVLSYGMAGNGTSTHLAGELFKYLAKLDIQAVAYKGGAPVLADLMAGQIPMSFNNIPESIGQIRAGAVRPLGVTTASRSPALPEVPTIAEAGLPGYDTAVWWGVLGPGDMAKPLVAELNAAFGKALATAAVKERFNTLGAVMVGGTAEAFAAHIKADADQWGPVIKAAGLKPE